jgi:hypothetical protein
MGDLRGKYRFPYRGFDMDVGNNSAVLRRRIDTARPAQE